MRNLERNKRPFWYCLYNGETELVDDDGYPTGERAVTYAKPVRVMGNVSAASGNAYTERFGVGASYDKVIVLEGTDWPIGETTALFVDKEPPEDFDPADVEYDYRVVRVSPSLNQTAIAISEVR